MCSMCETMCLCGKQTPILKLRPHPGSEIPLHGIFSEI